MGPGAAQGALVPREVSPAPAGGHRAPPAALSSAPNLLGLLQALRRRWVLAVGLGILVATAASSAMWVLRPVTFTARTMLHVAPTPYYVLWRNAEGGTDFGSYQRAQVALVKSRLVLNSALRDPKVAALLCVREQVEPVEWLEKMVQADFSIAPENLRITITGEEASELKILVAAVRDAYKTEIAEKETKYRLDRLGKLKELYTGYDRSLQEKRDTLKKMADPIGSKDPKLIAPLQRLALGHVNDLQSELLRTESEIRSLQSQVAVYEAREKGTKPVLVPDSFVEAQLDKDLRIDRLRKEIARHEQEIAGFQERSPDPTSEPGYQRAKQALAAAKKTLAERRQELRPEVTAQMAERGQIEMKSTHLQRQDRLVFLQDLEKRLREEVEKANQNVARLRTGTINLEWLQDEITQVDTITKEVARQKQILEVEMEAPSRVTQLEEAIVLPAQTTAGRIRMAALAGLAGFGVMLFGVAFLEFRMRRVGSVEEVTQGLKMKLVGALPLVPRRALSGAAGTQAVYWQNRLTESVDAIRTTLLNTARFEHLRVVMVTSAVGGEGKTMLSCHLAASLARAGCRTLLIDADLRRPAVHQMFGLSPERGLGEVLRGMVTAGEAIQHGLVDDLAVMPAGQSGSDAVHALARKGIGGVLDQLREQYDFIVVDSAPVLPVADSQLIGQHADGVVFSVVRGVSRLPEVYAAQERLALLRIRILGAVVSGTSGSAYGSGYDYATPVTPRQEPEIATERPSV